MGLFSHKCPKCQGPLERTGYAAPYPSHRCPRCIADNAAKAKIASLEQRLETLEKADN